MPVRYRRLVFGVEAGDLDRLAGALWECGTLGIEELGDAGAGSVIAYFAEDARCSGVDWGRFGARLLASEAYEELDWMAAYRERARPLPVGQRLIVDPREPEQAGEWAGPEVATQPGRRLLRLPARTAFGTGSHASTRLVVELLDEMELNGLSVLDVGAGSGILSFAAHLFGAARVVGVEIDLGAALLAAQNRRLNDLFPAFVAGGVGALESVSSFDLALVNVLPDRVSADLGQIRRLLRRGGSAIFSGILTDAVADVEARLVRAGFRRRCLRTSEEWGALLVEVGGE